MRLEPVYLVAPEPTPPHTDRRTLLVRAAFLGAGVFLGGGLGYWIGTRNSDAAPSPADAPASARLEWALRLQTGPLDRFASEHASYLVVFDLEPGARDRFWSGLRRLAVAVLDDDPAVRGVRRDVAKLMAQTLEYCSPPRDLARLVPALRRLAR